MHKLGIRNSRLGTARKNYASAYNNYKDWQDGYTQARNNRRKNTATNIGANTDRVVRSIGSEVRKAKSNLNSAKKTLKAETQMAKDYYKKVKGSR